ncbi:MAG: TATA-box-binding protein [archaeon]
MAKKNIPDVPVIKTSAEEKQIKTIAMDAEIKIQNIVVSANTHTKFSLEMLAANLDEAEYEPESFPGLVYRVKDPKASTLIFTTGKIICSGSKSFEDAKKAIDKTAEAFKALGIDVSDHIDVEIVNIVASANLKAKLDLNKIVFELGECEYEPEQFPGLVYRLDVPKVVFLIFNSGKIVCTGAKSEDIVSLSIVRLREKLESIGALK